MLQRLIIALYKVKAENTSEKLFIENTKTFSLF